MTPQAPTGEAAAELREAAAELQRRPAGTEARTPQAPTGEAAAELREAAAELQRRPAGTGASPRAGHGPRPYATLGGTGASPSPYATLGPVPDLDNRRFCRACATTLPVGAFP